MQHTALCVNLCCRLRDSRQQFCGRKNLKHSIASLVKQQQTSPTHPPPNTHTHTRTHLRLQRHRDVDRVCCCARRRQCCAGLGQVAHRVMHCRGEGVRRGGLKRCCVTAAAASVLTRHLRSDSASASHSDANAPLLSSRWMSTSSSLSSSFFTSLFRLWVGVGGEGGKGEGGVCEGESLSF